MEITKKNYCLTMEGKEQFKAEQITYNTKVFLNYPIFLNMKLFNKAIKELAKVYKSSYDDLEEVHTIFACQGSSGMSMASQLCLYIPNSHIHYVRKEPEREVSHRSDCKLDLDYLVNEHDCRIVFVDDLVDTGKTLFQVCDNVLMTYLKPVEVFLTYAHPTGWAELNLRNMSECERKLLLPVKRWICSDVSTG